MAILDKESLDFIGEAGGRVSNLKELSVMFDAPEKFAHEHKLELTDHVEKKLREVAKRRDSLSFPANDPLSKEVISFFNKVVIDGRYVQKWFHDPQGVAKELDIKVSDKMLERIKEVELSSIINVDEVYAAAIPKKLIRVVIDIVVDIVVSILLGNSEVLAIEPMVVDRSKLDKL